jgi:hypothetical protein
MARRPLYTFDLPNPKIGKIVRAEVRLAEGYEHTWEIELPDPDAPLKLRDNVGVFSMTMVSPWEKWLIMSEPWSRPDVRKQGYGLCLYLAAALFAGKMKFRGVHADNALSDEAHHIWNAMSRHGVARCSRPGDATTCYLRVEDVKELLQRHRNPLATP